MTLKRLSRSQIENRVFDRQAIMFIDKDREAVFEIESCPDEKTDSLLALELSYLACRESGLLK